jgi:type 2 lantibiotic biosynthesis protein LanM
MVKMHTNPAEKSHALWQIPGWYHALTLTERIADLRLQANKQRISKMDQSGDTKRAKRILQRWKEQTPFNAGSFFADRLAMDSISETDLFALLAEPIEAVQQRLLSNAAPPDWLLELTWAFQEGIGSTGTLLAMQSVNGVNNNSARESMLKPFQPLLARGIHRLQMGIADLSQAYAHLPFDLQTIEPLLLANLSQSFLHAISKTLVLEMHVARLQERLQGETSEDRFQSFIRLLEEPRNMLTLLEEYCVLARCIVEMIDLWVNYSLEFLTHLCLDWDDIRHLFSPQNDPCLLVEVQAGAGDTHREGRSVMLLKFASGFRLVYKPRSLAADVHFQELLAWLNKHGQSPAFRTIKLLDRSTYGWSEFVAVSGCTSRQEIERFYERQGAYLALLYALHAIDFHAENVIAAGEHPVLIDLEALFHPRIRKGERADSGSRLAHPAQKALDSSVLAVGLLPARLWSSEDAAGVDISGLGGQEGQFTPRPVARWEGTGTDEMRLVRERVKLAVSHNRPSLNGNDVQTIDYHEQIITGFTKTYRLLVEHRGALLTERLPRFSTDEIRFIARPTRNYALLLWESFHPNLLRDALKRGRFFDRLWLSVREEPALAQLIPAEQADLLRGDIPMFTTHPGSRDLFNSKWERIAGFFEESSMELTRKRVQQLDEDDLARQLWMIRASFTSLFVGTDTNRVPKEMRSRPSPPVATREQLIIAPPFS